jgi:hypothetical protein
VGKFLLVIVLFAAVVYAGFWLMERRRGLKTAPVRNPLAQPPKRAVAPDDDEDFLRELERRRRKAARDQKPEKPPKPTKPKKPSSSEDKGAEKPDKSSGKDQDQSSPE